MKWNEIAESEKYQNLPPEHQSAAQDKYFNQFIAPRLQDNQVEPVRARFTELANPGKTLEAQNDPDQDEVGYWSNNLRLLGERATDIGGNLAEFVSQSAEYMEDNVVGLGGFVFEEGKAFPRYVGGEKWKKLSEGGMRDMVRDAGQSMRDIELGGEHRHTPKQIKAEWKEGDYLGVAGEAGAYIGETFTQSVADMAAIMASLPTYVLSFSSQLGQDRAKNKGKEQADITDTMEAMPFAIGSALLERVVPSRMLKSITGKQKQQIGSEVVKTVAPGIRKKVLQGAGTEALTEFLQEGVLEYVGTKWGTEAKMSLGEAVEQGAWASLAGAGGGAFMGGIDGAFAKAPQQNKTSADQAKELEDEITHESGFELEEELDLDAELERQEQELTGLKKALDEVQSRQRARAEMAELQIEEAQEIEAEVQQIKLAGNESDFRSLPDIIAAAKVERESNFDLGEEIRSLEGIVHEDRKQSQMEQMFTERETIPETDPVQLEVDAAAAPSLKYLASKYRGKTEKLQQSIVGKKTTPPNGVMRDALSAALGDVTAKDVGENTKKRQRIQWNKAMLHAPVQEAVKRPHFKTIDTKADELLVAIAKLGGLNMEEAKTQGIDPEHFRDRVGWRNPFRANGTSFDAMAEKLSQFGYSDFSANNLLDKVSHSLGGQPQYTPEGVEYQAEQAHLEDLRYRALDEGDQTPLEGAYDSEVESSIDAELDAKIKVAGHLVDDAINAGVNLDDIHAVVYDDSLNWAELAGRIKALISNAREAKYAEAQIHAPRQSDSDARTGDQGRQGAEGEWEAEFARAEGATQLTEREAESLLGLFDGPVALLEHKPDPLLNSYSESDPAGANPKQAKKVIPSLFDDLEQAAKEVDTNPTEAQIEAGNYKKGHVSIQGLDITLENPKGSTRSGTDPNGKSWSITMEHHYGYIKRTEGADGDHVDVFIGPDPDSDKVFIVDQVNQDGSFDEHKVMIGFTSKLRARTGYKSNYSKGWKVGPITEMSMEEFKRWLDTDDTSKPFQLDHLVPAKVTKPKSLFDELAGIEASDLESMIDNVAAELENDNKLVDTAKPRRARPKKTKPKDPTKKPNLKKTATAAETAKPNQVEKTASKIAKNMGVNFSSAGENALKGLTELFGGAGKLNSGLTFDEDTYAKAKPHFEAMLKDFSAAGQDLRALIKAILENFGTGAKPYILRFTKDIVTKESNHVPSTNNNLERDRANGKPAKRVGKRNIFDDARADGFSDGQGSQNDKSGKQGGRGLADSSSSVLGEQGNPELDQENRANRVATSTTGSSKSGRSDLFGNTGTQAESRAGRVIAKPAGESQLDQKHTEQVKANQLPVKFGDRASIEASLPYLLPEQRDDVFKAEQRLFTNWNPDQRGILFTNGTGTGKTFTGLGTANRFYRSGKKNILIVVPSDAKAKDWIEDGAKMDLPISQLRDTKDGGRDVAVTTYANFYQNLRIHQRDFDLVMYDESHRLNSAGDNWNRTSAQEAHFALTNNDLHKKALFTHPKYVELKDGRNERIKRIGKQILKAEKQKLIDDDIRKRATSQADEEIKVDIQSFYGELRPTGKHGKKIYPKYKNTELGKVVFLSASPFSYHFNLDYAQGYLFDWDNGKKENDGLAYNSGDNRDQFYMGAFGYRMRYNKLTIPETGVDVSLMEMSFHENLKENGAVSGRALDIDFDYSRHFVRFDSKLGRKIDDGMRLASGWYEWDTGLRKEMANRVKKYIAKHGDTPVELKEHSTDDLPAVDLPDFRYFNEASRKHWTYNRTVQLREALLAQNLQERIRSHLDIGRQVVIFHDFQKQKIEHPFAFGKMKMGVNVTGDEAAIQAAYTDFHQEVEFFDDLFPEFRRLPLGKLDSVASTISNEFGGEAVFFSGRVSKADKVRAKQLFNDESAQPKIIVVQRASGKEGLSLHDVTGNMPRALLDMGLPVRPTDALQTEGRIYRYGQMSNAVIEYPVLGTSFEKFQFADKISKRIRTAENLAMGKEARALEEAFAEGYVDADDLDVSLEQGVGGKKGDRQIRVISSFDEAKTYYFGQQKNNKRGDQREGKDYFATPEPLGSKMVEWLDLKPNDHALEPSAGHGAIARFLPGDTNNTFIEPSMGLAERLAITARNGETKVQDFESLSIVNKYDGIVMNPPFGRGGSSAIPHLRKAMLHLRNGGRVIAILPEGPAADKKLEALNEDKKLKDVYQVADIGLPDVTFVRAGTKVKTHIVIFERQKNSEDAPNSISRRDVSADTVEEFFDHIEGMSVPSRGIPSEPEKASKVNTEIFTTMDSAHTKHGHDLFVVNANESMGDEYDRLNSIAKKHGGFYIRAKLRNYYKPKDGSSTNGTPTFSFDSEVNRSKFMEETSTEDYTVREPSPSYDQLELSFEQDPEKTSEADGRARAEAGESFSRWNSRAGTTILANGVTRDFKEKGEVSLLGQIVKTPEDLANLAEVYRNPKFETFRVFFINDNKVVGQTGVTSRWPNAVGGMGPEFADSLNKQMANLGATGYYLQHNHPSGIPNPSKADLHVTIAFAEKIPGFLGHVVINGNKFALIPPEVTRYPDKYEILHKRKPKGYEVGKNPIQDHPFLGFSINSPVDLAHIASSIVHDGDSMEIVARRGSDGAVIGIATINASRVKAGLVSKVGIKRLLVELKQFQQQTAAADLFAVNVPPELEAGLKQALMGGFFTDVVAADFESMRNHGVNPTGRGFEPKAIQVREEDSKYGNDELESGLNALGLKKKKSTLADKVNKVKKTDFKSIIDNLKKRAYEGVFDGLVGIDRAEKAAGKGIAAGDHENSGYVGARLATGIADLMHAILNYGAPKWRGGVIEYQEGTEGLLEIFSRLGEDLENWLGWMGGNRGQELMDQGRENNLTQADIDALKNLDKGKEKAFAEAKRKYNQLNTAMLDLAQDAGLIKGAERKNWASDWYVPFYRQDIDGNGLMAPRTKRGLSHQSSGIKALKGGEVATNDLLGNIITNWMKLADSSMKNMALLKTVDNLEGTDYITNESLKYTQAIVPKSEIVKRIKGDRNYLELMAEMLGMDQTSAEMEVLHELAKLESSGYEKLWAITAPTDPDVVRVQRNGKNEYYRVNQDNDGGALLRGLAHLSNTSNNNVLMRGARGFKRLLTTGVTSSPDFMLRNLIRDAAHAWAINKDGFKFGADTIKGMKGAFTQDPDYRELMFANASFQGGYVHGTDPEATAQIVRRSLKKKGLTDRQIKNHINSIADGVGRGWDNVEKAWQIYREQGDKLENSNRLATFKAAKKAGKPLAQAVFESKDLMDYSLRGNFAAMNFLTDVVPFLNARLQGLSKLGRAAEFKGDLRKPWTWRMDKQVTMAITKIALFSGLLALLNDDDERYQELPDWEKDAYWHILMGEHHFRLPKPFEIGIVAGTIPERMMHTWVLDNQPDKKLLWSLKHGLLETLGFNPIPQAVLPVLELWGNKSYHFDTPIESLSDQRKRPEDRYNSHTSDTAIWLGQLTGQSPKQLQHLWKGYTGTMGAYSLSAVDSIGALFSDKPNGGELLASDIPVVKSFYRGTSPHYATQYTADLYKRLRDVNQLAASLKELRGAERKEFLDMNVDKLKVKKLLGKVSSKLRRLRKRRDHILNDEDMSRSEKQKLLDAIQEKMNQVSQMGIQRTEGAF